MSHVLRVLGQVRTALPYLFSERREALEHHRLATVAYDSKLLTMGRASYGEPRISTFPGEREHVSVGSFVSIGLDVVLLDGGDHRTDWITTFPLRARLNLPGAYEDGHPRSKGDTVIGNDVWIGSGARVLSGVTIGHGAVVGGHSVVTRNVRPYAVAAGNPAREVRRRFSDEQIDSLLQIAWWDWPMTKILECVDILSDNDIDRFIATHSL